MEGIAAPYNTLIATGVKKNPEASSKNPVVNAAENAVRNAVSPHYVTLLSDSAQQKTKEQKFCCFFLFQSFRPLSDPYWSEDK